MLNRATMKELTSRMCRTVDPILQSAIASNCLREVNGTLLLALALLAPHATAQTLHSFTGGADGQYPFAGLTIDKNGALYGTTEYGGNSPTCTDPIGCGTVFEVEPPSSPGGAWTESVIYAFPKFSLPLASPTVGPNGELYGTTYYGGTHYVGSVFALTPPSSPDGTWTETTLYSFSPAYGDPQNPEAGVVIGKNGVLYGTVQFAGLSPNCPYSYQSKYGCGGVFSLTPPASPGEAWTEQTLYTFTGGNDGAVPLTDLVIGKNGELYGTTYFGGPSSNCSDTGCGTVFRLEPPGSPGEAWTETVLYSFTGSSDGGFPNAVVYRDGVLYGTVTFGGDPKNCGGVGCGGVFRLSPPAAAGERWKEAVIYSFTGVPDGLYPAAGPVIGRDGKLYGTTRDGGDSKSCPEDPGCGVVFQLTPPRDWNGAWRENVLHSFTAADGFRPTAGLVVGHDGDLYGTTLLGGPSTTALPGGGGTVFRVRRNNSGEAETDQ